MTAQQPIQINLSRRWIDKLKEQHDRIVDIPSELIVEGVVTRIVGLTIEAVGLNTAIGGRCYLVLPDQTKIYAEVVGFSGERLFLMPTGDIRGLMPGARVIPEFHVFEVPAGEALLGRVIDGAAEPLDGKGPINVKGRMPLNGRTINPLTRDPIHKMLDVGVRAINSLLTIGQGQRMGLFAGSGVGKSVLLGMMTRFTSADVVVV